MSEKVSPEIEALLNEDRSFAPSDEFRSRALVNDPDIYAKAAKDPEAFWTGFAKELEWIAPWSKVLEWNPPDAKWFVGGKINIAANCLDRHVRTARRNKAAFIWEGEPGDRRTLTYFDLYRQVCQFANVLKVARREEGRSCRAVSAAHPRARDFDARMRAHRRGALRCLRRLQRRVASRPHQRLVMQGARHRRRRLAPRPDRAAQADRRRSAQGHAIDRARRHRPAPARLAAADSCHGRPRPLVSPPDAGRARTSARRR